MILHHGSLLGPDDVRAILTTGLRPHPSHWASEHLRDRERFVFASTRVTGSPGGDPMAFARGWPMPPRARRDARGLIFVLDVERRDVVGTIPNDALARTFAVRAALRVLDGDTVATVLAHGGHDAAFTPVVTARPRDLPDVPRIVLAFHDDLRRARTAETTARVLQSYGVVDGDDVADLLDSHTRSCAMCIDGRAGVALTIPGTTVRLPLHVGGESVAEATWRFLCRVLGEVGLAHQIDWRGRRGVVDVIAALPAQAALPRVLRADTLTGFIDEDLRSDNVQVLLDAVPPARIRGAIVVSPDGRRWAEPLRYTRRPADVVAAAVGDLLRGRPPSSGLQVLVPPTTST